MTTMTTEPANRSGSPALSDVSTSSRSRNMSAHSAGHANRLTEYLQTSFLVAFLPSHVEYAEKEAKRQRLEALAHSVLPGARLLPFGSTANGLSLRHSDMDLCCLLPLSPDEPRRPASELVEVLGGILQQETDIQVKMLPRARIPIIKLTFPATASLPFGLACDIGFENELALRNTRLLLTYAVVDSRLRTLVLFIKVWTKRRKINNPYLGTLSSYGYVLMVIHFLINMTRPPVLPNLQRMVPMQPIPLELAEFDGYNTYFFDDIELLSHVWPSTNNDNVGELLIAFFDYFSRRFDYANSVISIRSERGLLSKADKGWLVNREMESEFYGGPRDLSRLCIEDPFQINYNVARTVTRDGLYTIRAEIRRAYKMLSGTTERMSSVVNELCQDRDEILMTVPPGASASGSRRKSAPSPRIPPANLGFNAQDFRNWYQTNGHPVPPNYQRPFGYASTSSVPYGNTYPAQNHFERNVNEFGQSYGTGRSTYPYNYRGNRYPNRGYNQSGNQRRNQQLSSSASLPSSPPQFERRLSWDGGVGNLDVSGPIPKPTYASSETGQAASYTAPTSPIFGSSTINTSRTLAQSNGLHTPHPRSQSHSGGDRRSLTNVLSASTPPVRSRPVSGISFGDFSSITSVMDAALAREDDKRRRGMEPIDSESEVIEFGDVRIFRRTSRASGQAPQRSVISRLGPHRPTALPQVVEAIENRPSTPLSPAALPPAAPAVRVAPDFGARHRPMPTVEDVVSMAQSLSSMHMDHSNVSR